MRKKSDKFFEKRQELIEAAILEFGEKGYEEASLNNILKKAGISKGTFYYHFKNKEKLYVFLVGILVEEKKSYFNKNIKAEVFDKDIYTLLKHLTKVGIKFAKKNPYVSKFSQSLMKQKGTKIYTKAINSVSNEKNDYLNHLIDNAYKKGEIRNDLPKSFVKKVISYLFTHIQDIIDINEVDEFEEPLNNMIDFIKSGFESK